MKWWLQVKIGRKKYLPTKFVKLKINTCEHTIREFEKPVFCPSLLESSATSKPVRICVRKRERDRMSQYYTNQKHNLNTCITFIENLDAQVVTGDAPCIFISRGTYRDLGGYHQESRNRFSYDSQIKKEINASYNQAHPNFLSMLLW